MEMWQASQEIRMSPSKRRTGRWLQRERERYFKLYPLCKRCESKRRIAAATELDHIVPLFKGGKDIRANKQGLCTPCHAEKTAEDMAYTKPVRVGVDGFPIEDDE